MVKKYRDLTEKYKAFRLQPDAVYQSRTIQTVFNKFTIGGEKKTARKLIFISLQRLRYSLRKPTLYRVILRILRSLRVQFILAAKREGRKTVDVPVPVRRNKRDIMNIQLFANSVRKRQDRAFSENLLQELTVLTLKRDTSSTLRQLDTLAHRVYDERTNLEKR